MTGRLCPLLISYKRTWPCFEIVDTALEVNGSEKHTSDTQTGTRSYNNNQYVHSKYKDFMLKPYELTKKPPNILNNLCMVCNLPEVCLV